MTQTRILQRKIILSFDYRVDVHVSDRIMDGIFNKNILKYTLLHAFIRKMIIKFSICENVILHIICISTSHVCYMK